ncbi:MAG TPA: hypothetical protein VH857_06045 [Actinomycetes bacterium]|jgi:hypothetical protein|nr:hypothetical protein [Actinomycetes bacterium]
MTRLSSTHYLSPETGAELSRPSLPLPRGQDPHRVTAEQVDRARLSVARSATDAEDCRQLLDMLGLIAGEDGIPPVRR